MKNKNEIFKITGYRGILIYLHGHQIREENITKIYKNSKTVQYTLVQQYISNLEKYGLVATRKEGRNRFVRLTEKGKEISRLFIRINKLMEED